VSPPAWSIARRAARILSIATASSYSGAAASPVESSIESPATPVSTASRTFRETPAASRAKPLSKSALIGRSVAAAMSARCCSTPSSVTAPSRHARDQAKPELVVASALKPRPCR
jgi:hypothetical protein